MTLTAEKAKAEAWKQAVAREIAAQHTGGYVRESAAVRLTFNLVPDRFRDTALFNLLKLAIDGMSNVVFAPASSGQTGRWSREDWRIAELHARKTRAVGAPYADITIEPIGSTPREFTGLPLPPAFVPGSVPSLSGDAAGQARVVEWRRTIENHLHMTGVATAFTQIAIRFMFRIEQSRMDTTDLDNLCVPACQAVCHAVYGDLRHGQNLVAFDAVKAPARSSTDLGTQVSVWLV